MTTKHRLSGYWRYNKKTKLFSKRRMIRSFKSISILFIPMIVFALILMLFSELIIETLANLKVVTGLEVHNGLSFEIGVLLIGLFGIILMIRRMNQTDKQIEIISSVNKFSNYYTHREKFVNYLIDVPLIQIVSKPSPLTAKQLITNYHKIYFGKSPKSFTGELKDEIIERARDFIYEIEKSALSDYYSIIELFEDIDLRLLRRIENIFNYHHYELNIYYKTKLKEDGDSNNIYNKLSWDKKDRINYLAKIYFTQKLIIEILSFTEESLTNYIAYNFQNNVESYFKSKKIEQLLLVEL